MATPTATTNKSSSKTPTCIDKTPLSELDLSIISFLAAAQNPAKITAKLNLSKSALQYHLTKLKRLEIIRKLGYATWEVINPPESTEKRSTNSSRVGTPQDPPSRLLPRLLPGSQSNLLRFQQDAVRAHAITTTWRIPSQLRNWDNKKRSQYLTTHNIPHIQLGIGGGGQRIIVKDRKVWLLNSSVIIYDKASYFAETALEGKSTAIATHLSIIKHIERLLHVSFEIGSDHQFKVSRQHYALIHNALASQYNESGEKLEIRTGKGLWLLIDDSFSMNELETVHPSTAMTDNDKVKKFFNGLKDIPAVQGAPTYTPSAVLEMIHGVAANQAAFAENMTTTIKQLKELQRNDNICHEGTPPLTSFFKELQ